MTVSIQYKYHPPAFENNFRRSLRAHMLLCMHYAQPHRHSYCVPVSQKRKLRPRGGKIVAQSYTSSKMAKLLFNLSLCDSGIQTLNHRATQLTSCPGYFKLQPTQDILIFTLTAVFKMRSTLTVTPKSSILRSFGKRRIHCYWRDQETNKLGEMTLKQQK